MGTAKIAELVRDRDQLWGEAAAVERTDFSIRLPRELWSAAAAEQKKREADNPFVEILQAAFAGHEAGKISSADVYRLLKVDGAQASVQRQEMAGLAMKAIGWEKRDGVKLRGGKVLKGFYRSHPTQGSVPELTVDYHQGRLDVVKTLGGDLVGSDEDW